MTNIFAGYRPIFPQPIWNATLTKLQQVIGGGADHWIEIPYGGTEIKGYLVNISNAVERAFVLTPREALPKITLVTNNPDKRRFSFAGDPFTPHTTDPNHTAEQARKTAAKWLSIAAYLEAEEKVKADEAKKKADAEKAEANARTKRRDELADLYFGEYFDALGTKKASAIEQIYHLEQELKADKDAA